ncbi:MAG: sigma-70 family RNA polymerase sigma factor [Sandaracinaceae bacterium]|nr:sigma-70 family RNA polymerase sigma factor [Sandaracinaceae bacterium]
MGAATAAVGLPDGPGSGAHRVGAAAAPRLRLEEVYDAHVDFVWRSARRMGVPQEAVDDVVQEVFLVVHRRLDDFEGRSSVKTWLFGILLRVVSDHRRRHRRKGGLAPLPEALAAEPDRSCPAEQLERRTQLELLHALLMGLDDDKRAVFVLAELEQLTAPEIADALGIKLNTVYSRLRAARKEFEEALARHRAREARR